MGTKGDRATGHVPEVVMSVGLGLGLLTIVEVGVWANAGTLTPSVFLGSVLMSLFFAAVLVFGGHRLHEEPLSTSEHRQVLYGTIAGLGVFAAFVGTLATLQFGSLWNIVAAGRWGASIGAAMGFMIGFVSARSVQEAVELERARVRAETAEEQRELLEYVNSILRHEVLNAANVIGGYATRLAEDEDGSEAEIIQRQADHLTQITREVRVLIAASENLDVQEPCDVVEIISEELRAVEDREPAVQTHLEAPESAVVVADDLLSRLFSNLIDNAVRHNEGESASVEVNVRTGGDTVTVTVRDNGPGVPEAIRPTLFEPEPGTDAGHGLGLTIVGRLVERYDGSVELTDTGPDGSTFRVELPRSGRGDPA